ncbi:hypothetical protein MAHJHV45_06740 [Mycobacterium avium subsp. hominissuis]
MAWAAARSAWAAVVIIHATYGAAAAAIDTDAGPCHDPATNPEISDP